jgi:hypothetical protein
MPGGGPCQAPWGACPRAVRPGGVANADAGRHGPPGARSGRGRRGAGGLRSAGAEAHGVGRCAVRDVPATRGPLGGVVTRSRGSVTGAHSGYTGAQGNGTVCSYRGACCTGPVGRGCPGGVVRRGVDMGCSGAGYVLRRLFSALSTTVHLFMCAGMHITPRAPCIYAPWPLVATLRTHMHVHIGTHSDQGEACLSSRSVHAPAANRRAPPPSKCSRSGELWPAQLSCAPNFSISG